MRLRVSKIITMLFVLTYMSLSFTDAIYIAHDRTSPLTYIKYLTMLSAIGVGLLSFISNREKKYVFVSQLINYGFITIIFLLISLIKSLFVGQFAKETIAELFDFSLSIMFAFVVLNTISFKQISIAFRFILVSAFTAYVFFEIGLSKFTPSAFASISFIDSYSPFESSFSAGMAITLFMFFAYYRRVKLWTVISAIFALLAFKRISVLYTILLLILPVFMDVNQYISKRWITLIKVVFIVSSIAYYILLLPSTAPWVQNNLGMDISKFTMGRDGFLQTLMNSDYKSYGYGSSIDYNDRNIEMDYVRMLIEVGAVGLIVYINCYWNMCKGHFYCILISLYAAITELFSHDLGHAFKPSLSFIIMGCILYKEKGDFDSLRYGYKEKKKKIKIKIN